MNCTEVNLLFTANTVELLYRPQKMKPIERTLLWTMVLLVVAVGLYFLQWEMFDAQHVHRVIDTTLEHPLPLLSVLAAVVGSFLIPAKMRRTRIHIDGSGMRLVSSLPFFGETVERKILWDKVSSVSYVRSTSALSIRTKAGLPWVLRAADWSRATDGSVSNARPTQADPDLVATLRGMGLLERKSAATAIGEFDLMGDRRTRLLIVLAALAGLYAAFDGMKNPESWAFFNLKYEIPHLVIGGLFAIGVGAWLAVPSSGGRHWTAPSLRGWPSLLSLQRRRPATLASCASTNSWADRSRRSTITGTRHV